MARSGQIKYRYQGKFDPGKLKPDNIDRLSLEMVPEKSKVLELGAATGFMGEWLARVKKCRVSGVEMDSEAYKQAYRFYQGGMILGNLEDKETWWEIKRWGKFDVVLASAILEHLRSPELALERIRKVLKPKGILVLTLPNIAHWRMRLNLHLGRWDYEDYGILDRTHLRFFTYFTAVKLVRRSGFRVKKVAIDPAGGLKYFNWLVKRWPNLYAYQIAIQATKS